MSDLPPPPNPSSPPPGWWQASDGNWYPPSDAPGTPPPPPSGGNDPASYAPSRYVAGSYPPAGAVRADNPQATAGMILGIVAIVLSWTLIGGWVLGLLAIIFGAIGRSKAPPHQGRGTAGIICGVAAMLLPILFIVAIQVAGDSADEQFDCTGRALDDNPFNDCDP